MKNLEDVRNDILSHAQSLFARYGFDKTTISDITAGGGRCKSSVYYHFKNKADIFRGVVRMEFDAIRQELDKVLEHRAEDPAKAFAEYIRRRIELLEVAVAYSNAVTGNSSLAKHLVEQERSDFDNWEKDFFGSVWRGTIDAGIIPPTISMEAYTNTLSGLIRGIETQYFNAEDKSSIIDLCSTMAELLIHRNPNFHKPATGETTKNQ